MVAIAAINSSSEMMIEVALGGVGDVRGGWDEVSASSISSTGSSTHDSFLPFVMAKSKKTATPSIPPAISGVLVPKLQSISIGDIVRYVIQPSPAPTTSPIPVRINRSRVMDGPFHTHTSSVAGFSSSSRTVARYCAAIAPSTMR